MAGRNSGSVGDGGKVGRPKTDVKQRKLTVEEGKKVRFEIPEDKKGGEESKVMMEMLEKIEKEMKTLKEERERHRMGAEELKKLERNREDRISKIEGKVEELERMLKECIDKLEISEQRGERAETCSMISSGGRGSRATSVLSVMSEDRFSERDVGRLKRLITEKDKEERKNNIAIKGIELPKEIGEDRKGRVEWAKRFLKEKIGIECNIEQCKKNGTVIIVKLDREETKREVMKNKNKLKGGTVFIENDLTWEERRKQERISRWVKIQKEKGKEVKVGIGRVKIGNVWRLWADIEREENKEVRKESEMDNGEGKGINEGNKGN